MTSPIKYFQHFPLGNALVFPVPTSLPEPIPAQNFEIALNLSGLQDLGLHEFNPIDHRFLRAKHSTGNVVMELVRRCAGLLPPRIHFFPHSPAVVEETPDQNLTLLLKEKVATIKPTEYPHFQHYDGLGLHFYEAHPGGVIRIPVRDRNGDSMFLKTIDLREADGSDPDPYEAALCKQQTATEDSATRSKNRRKVRHQSSLAEVRGSRSIAVRTCRDAALHQAEHLSQMHRTILCSKRTYLKLYRE